MPLKTKLRLSASMIDSVTSGGLLDSNTAASLHATRAVPLSSATPRQSQGRCTAGLSWYMPATTTTTTVCMRAGVHMHGRRGDSTTHDSWRARSSSSESLTSYTFSFSSLVAFGPPTASFLICSRTACNGREGVGGPHVVPGAVNARRHP